MNIFVFDGKDVPDPQNMAMLQALYSRDQTSVAIQMNKLRNVTKFMDNYVVKYGHGSIAQCGYITIFAENVSMYLAKVIEHHNYYCGQETSTRYVDFSARQAVSVTPEYAKIQDEWFDIYDEALIQQRDVIAKANFNKKYENLSVDEKKKVNPRAFDMARGFLPFGAKTNVSWTTNFDNLWKHLSWIKANFIVPEMQEFVSSVETMVREKYPDSFPALLGEEGSGASRENMGNEAFPMLSTLEFGLTNSTWIPNGEKLRSDSTTWLSISDSEIKRKQAVNDIYITGTIDLGSWRDLQRHRNTIQAWPSWTDTLHPFYMQNLSSSLVWKIENLWKRTQQTIISCKKTDLIITWRDESWLIVPLAVNIEYGLKMSINQMFYIIRARYQETVHPTVRFEMYKWIINYLSIYFSNTNKSGSTTIVENNIVKNPEQYHSVFKRENIRYDVLMSAKDALTTYSKISLKRANQTIEEKK